MRKFLLYGALAASLAAADPRSFLSGSPAIPDATGVNIHFTAPRPGEMKMLAASGVRWIRMDFAWSATEKTHGHYDFSAYDGLLKALRPHGIRAVFILDYGNPLYDSGLAPSSDEGRAAFARWVTAAVSHCQGRGIVWEMWNEPNLKQFWKPRPSAADYSKLALATGRALRAAAPGEIYVGPATSRFPPDFLEQCFQAGLLEYWDAVSVHPYRKQAPETASTDFDTLRHLIEKYAPKGRKIPILSGEWGYTSVRSERDDGTQGKLLAREWLSDISAGIPLSIWYDWHDDGTDPAEREHHFGIVLFPYHEGRNPVYGPKPAYRAARTLNETLAGYHFVERMHLSQGEFALVFAKGKLRRYAVWTTSDKPHHASIPVPRGHWRVRSYLGEAGPAVQATSDGITLELTNAPKYLLAGK